MIKTVLLRVGKGGTEYSTPFFGGPARVEAWFEANTVTSRNETQWNCWLAGMGTSFFEGLDLNFRWKIGPTQQDKFVRSRSFFRFGYVSGHEIFHKGSVTNFIVFILLWIYISIVGFKSKLLKLPQKDEMNNCWKVINKL